MALGEAVNIGRLLRSPITRLLLFAAAVGAAFPLAGEAKDALLRLESANPPAVVFAGLLHVGRLVASALCWRRAFRAFGSRIGGAASCVRYGVGTFVNAVAPARAGGALRIGLFTRTLSGERTIVRSGSALVAIGSVRAASVATLLGGAAATGLAPIWFVAAPVLVLGIAVTTRSRLRLVRDHFSTRCLAVLLGWAGLAAICRCTSIIAALVAVDVPSPITAGLVGLLGLELAALVPLAPGLAGVGGAAVAVAIAAHGVPTATATAGGVTFYAAEAVAGVLYGALATAAFLVKRPRLHRAELEMTFPFPSGNKVVAPPHGAA
jgi:xanthosine utilization system XapX-like protein